MVERSIGIFQGQPLSPNHKPNSLDRIKEDLALKGYSVIAPESDDNLDNIRNEIDSALENEIELFGATNLETINDFGVVRNPFLQSLECRKIIFSNRCLEVCEAIFGRQFILHVNRYVISDPRVLHPASVWHREPPYNNFIADKPMALTFIFFPDGSDENNSGLNLLPASHKWADFPSDDFVVKNQIVPKIEAGSTLVINSNLFHKGGEGGTSRRRSIVTIFTTPVIKQQTNLAKVIREQFPEIISELEDGSFLLGVDTETKDSDHTYRVSKLETKRKINS